MGPQGARVVGAAASASALSWASSSELDLALLDLDLAKRPWSPVARAEALRMLRKRTLRGRLCSAAAAAASSASASFIACVSSQNFLACSACVGPSATSATSWSPSSAFPSSHAPSSPSSGASCSRCDSPASSSQQSLGDMRLAQNRNSTAFVVVPATSTSWWFSVTIADESPHLSPPSMLDESPHHVFFLGSCRAAIASARYLRPSPLSLASSMRVVSRISCRPSTEPGGGGIGTLGLGCPNRPDTAVASAPSASASPCSTAVPLLCSRPSTPPPGSSAVAVAATGSSVPVTGASSCSCPCPCPRSVPFCPWPSPTPSASPSAAPSTASSEPVLKGPAAVAIG
mmetsp:Transcript_27008/g.55546  ORF Transcript_27008/g.55546 Transcript_27008/m.55546 type:complete len:344 (-) Transcript_27008:311-1342(-)